MRLFFCLSFLMCIGQSASAELSCQDGFAIARLLNVARTTDVPNAQMPGIYNDIAKLRLQSSTAIAHNRDMLALQPIAQLMLLLMSDAERSDNTRLLSRLRDPASVTTLTGALGILERQGCEPIDTAPQPDGSLAASTPHEADTDDEDATPFWSKMTRKEASLLGGIVVLAGVAATFLYGAFIRYQRRLQRRRRRYPCRVEAELNLGDRRHDTLVLDINCYGAKLQYFDDLDLDTGQGLIVMVKGKVIPCEIAWQNQHFCGVKFDKRLSVVAVLELIGKTVVIGARNKKAAPEGTA